DDFEGADDAGRVVRFEARGGLRIEGCEFGVERGRTFAGGALRERGAEVWIDAWHFGQALRQRFEVEAGAADEDRCLVSCANVSDRGERVGEPTAGGVALGGVDAAIEVMRRLGLLFYRRARGENAEIAIDLHAIGVDDFAADTLSQRQRQRGLAAGGRAHDEKGRDWGLRVGDWRCPAPIPKQYRLPPSSPIPNPQSQ